MNRTSFFTIALALAGLFAGCKKDNYDAPTSVLNGRVVYQGQPLGVRSNGVQLELWQGGYQLFSKIPIYIAQDGTFSASLFDGDYKLTRLRGNGPWADQTDTINISVRGTATVDVPVNPYFIVKTATAAKSGTNVTATVSMQHVNTARNLEFVRLYVGQTVITDATNNAGTATVLAAAIPDLTAPVTLTTAIPSSLAAKDYVYARVGIKTLGVAELLYSQPIKVALK